MRTLVPLALLGFIGVGSSCVAQPMSCGELSYQRNAIFKRAGYCFRTAAQARIFGNQGCQYENQADVPLSGRDRAAIAEIVRAERFEGCR